MTTSKKDNPAEETTSAEGNAEAGKEKAAPQEPSAAALRAQKAAEQAKAAAADAFAAFKSLLTDPVGQLGPAHDSLGDNRALGVGVVFGVVAAFGAALAASVMLGSLISMMMGAGLSTGLHFGMLLRSLISGLFAVAAAAGAIYLLSPLFGGKTRLGSSVYIAGTSFLPMGLAMLLAAIISAILTNRLGMILVSLLVIFGLCLTVLVLNAGLRHISGLNEQRASLATPAVLALAGIVNLLIAYLLA